jgi:DNA-binding NarL/FixJ family response regulator
MIHIHVACDDELYRSVIADFLAHQTDMAIVGASADDQLGAAASALADPDVVVLSIPPTRDGASHVEHFLELQREGAVIVAFCRTPEQADLYHRFGINLLVFSDQPARQLTEAVRAAANGTAPTKQPGPTTH